MAAIVFLSDSSGSVAGQEDTKDLIGRAGYGLTNSSKFDQMVLAL